MALINLEKREIWCKIVYYGPAMSGKTTSLFHLHSVYVGQPLEHIYSVATEHDRVLFLDLLRRIRIRGFDLNFRIYTIPGSVLHQSMRTKPLEGVDGIVFVADSQRHRLTENIASLRDFQAFMRPTLQRRPSLPIIMQYNKRDTASAMPIKTLQQKLNHQGWPFFETAATTGQGICETFAHLQDVVIKQL